MKYKSITMTQKEKSILLQDLCSRLPHKVHCRVFKLNRDIKENDDILYGIVGDNVMTLKSDKDECLMYYQIKPYLRPMESMTEEEKVEIRDLYHQNTQEVFKDPPEIRVYRFYDISVVNWLNRKGFDYRGLIPMGLALPATEDMYKN